MLRHGKGESIVGLQQNVLCLFQALTDGAADSLPKIAALGMLFMGAAVSKRDGQIRYRRTGKQARMCGFKDMGADKVLKLSGQNIGRQGA